MERFKLDENDVLMWIGILIASLALGWAFGDQWGGHRPHLGLLIGIVACGLFFALIEGVIEPRNRRLYPEMYRER